MEVARFFQAEASTSLVRTAIAFSFYLPLCLVRQLTVPIIFVASGFLNICRRLSTYRKPRPLRKAHSTLKVVPLSDWACGIAKTAVATAGM